MLNSVSHVTASRVRAVDGELGPVEDVLFDDRSWAIRYLVVDARAWLNERDVLISPYSIKQPVARGKPVEVALTRRLVRTSPDIDSRPPIPQAQERALLAHYHYPEYWAGEGLWSLKAMSFPLATPLSHASPQAASAHPAGFTLRSAGQVAGYQLQGTEGALGPVVDFVFDDESWLIRYLVVDPRGWWPGGGRVLIGLHWLDRVDWAARQVQVALTREQVRSSPAYDDAAALQRGDETLLHANYQRAGYWA